MMMRAAGDFGAKDMRSQRSRAIAILSLTLGAMAAASGCSSDSHTSGNNAGQPALATINDHCPVLGFKKVNPEAPTVDYKGQRIGFCCDKCPQTWAEWSEAKKDAFVARQLD